ncbi:hypothetical protein BDN71DRAFT_1432980 [Pleurotus eryngii]|uniref:Uncharacterized protein n=1 Tax=Pleurotus eryngii TaxID=5323 RepID=A0A9P5ZR36_PLEER|nr:hypothetical protein BDN71DRAFT_1432980 [Pleurotus eryngii]
MSTPLPVASSIDIIDNSGIPYVEGSRNYKDVFLIHSIVKLHRVLTPCCNNPNRLAALLVEVTQSLLSSIWHPNPIALFPMSSDVKLWTGILQELYTMAPGDEYEAARSLMQLFQFGFLYCHSALDIGTKLQHLLCAVSDRVFASKKSSKSVSTARWSTVLKKSNAEDGLLNENTIKAPGHLVSTANVLQTMRRTRNCSPKPPLPEVLVLEFRLQLCVSTAILPRRENATRILSSWVLSTRLAVLVERLMLPALCVAIWMRRPLRKIAEEFSSTRAAWNYFRGSCTRLNYIQLAWVAEHEGIHWDECHTRGKVLRKNPPFGHIHSSGEEPVLPDHSGMNASLITEGYVTEEFSQCTHKIEGITEIHSRVWGRMIDWYLARLTPSLRSVTSDNSHIATSSQPAVSNGLNDTLDLRLGIVNQYVGNYMRQYMELEPELRLLYAQNAELRCFAPLPPSDHLNISRTTARRQRKAYGNPVFLSLSQLCLPRPLWSASGRIPHPDSSMFPSDFLSSSNDLRTLLPP